MSPGEDMIVPKEALPRFKAVIDVIVSPKKTALIRAAEKLGLQAIPGMVITTQQALAQLKLYTGAAPTVKVAEKATSAYFKS
jgi:shikimate 5-dehydrogenase